MDQRRHHVDATHTPTSAAGPDTDDRRPAALAAAAHDAEVARAAVGTLPNLTGTPVVVMGVSGSGKTALALRLMDVLQLPYAEADEFHSAEAIAKMRGGTPLTDEDRWPWLRRLRSWMSEPAQSGGCIVTCSALRRSYRDLLSDAPGRVRFLHVEAATVDIQDRMAERHHFMPPALLASQVATLEPLQPDEDGVLLHNDGTLADLTERALRALV